jgi:hypothetical protein
MKKYILKDHVTKEMLGKVGFEIKKLLSGDVVAIRKNTPSSDIIIFLEPPERALKHRYASTDGNPFEAVKDIEDWFVIEHKEDEKSSPETNSSEKKIEVGKISLNDFAKEIHENAKNHGWWDQERSFGDILALVHSEISEALEEYRKGKSHVYFEKGTSKPEGISVELVDAMIRILDFMAKENVDIEKILIMKHEYNKTRSYKHGGKTM